MSHLPSRTVVVLAGPGSSCLGRSRCQYSVNVQVIRIVLFLRTHEWQHSHKYNLRFWKGTWKTFFFKQHLSPPSLPYFLGFYIFPSLSFWISLHYTCTPLAVSLPSVHLSHHSLSLSLLLVFLSIILNWKVKSNFSPLPTMCALLSDWGEDLYTTPRIITNLLCCCLCNPWLTKGATAWCWPWWLQWMKVF